MYKELMEEWHVFNSRKRTLVSKALRFVLSLSVVIALSYAVSRTPTVKLSSHIQLTSASAAGYWMASTNGSTYNFATLSLGSAAPFHPSKPIVGMAATPDGHGYWLVASDGGIFSFGDATFYGSMGGKTLNEPIVGMASTADGKGYWLVASDGGIFSFGDATFYGSMGGKTLNKPIVGMASTADGKGYWLVASDGGIFSFGDATFYGSMGGKTLNKPIVGMASTADGKGYWMVASDGGIFSFGDATFFGSMGGKPLVQPIVGMSSTSDSQGYWMVAADGGIFSFGDATFFGSMGGKQIPGPMVAIAADKAGNPFVSGQTGYDMSNYTTTIPPLSNIAIAESDGYPFLANRNPTMFEAEAKAAGSNLQLYSFLGAPFSGGTWQIAPTTSVFLTGPAGTCAPNNYLCQAVNYGWNEAAHSFLNAKSLGITSNIWWLDVETGGPWSTDTQINNGVIQGAMQYLQGQGALVGIYSTAYQWQQITGGLSIGTQANPLPIWIAAPDYQQAACTNQSLWFANGTPWLVQTGSNSTYNVDIDYAC